MTLDRFSTAWGDGCGDAGAWGGGGFGYNGGGWSDGNGFGSRLLGDEAIAPDPEEDA